MATTDTMDIVGKVVTWGLAGAVLFAGVGGVLGSLQVKKRNTALAAAKLKIPSSLHSIPGLTEPLLALAAEVRSFDAKSFGHLTSKLANMLRVAAMLQRAAPGAVEPSMRHIGNYYAEEIRGRLADFYTATKTLTVRTEDPAASRLVGAKAMLPLRTNLREAHKALVATVDTIAVEMSCLASDLLHAHLATRA